MICYKEMTLSKDNVNTSILETALTFSFSQGDTSSTSATMWIELNTAKTLGLSLNAGAPALSGTYGYRFFAHVFTNREDGSLIETEYPLNAYDAAGERITTLLDSNFDASNQIQNSRCSISVEASVGVAFRCSLSQRFYQLIHDDTWREVLLDLDTIGTQLNPHYIVVGKPFKPSLSLVSHKKDVTKYQEVMVNSQNSIGGASNCLLFKLYAVDSSGSLNPVYDTISVSGTKLNESSKSGENLINLNRSEDMLLGKYISTYVSPELNNSTIASAQVQRAETSIALARQNIIYHDLAEHASILANAVAADAAATAAATNALDLAVDSVNLVTAEVAFAQFVHQSTSANSSDITNVNGKLTNLNTNKSLKDKSLLVKNSITAAITKLTEFQTAYTTAKTALENLTNGSDETIARSLVDQLDTTATAEWRVTADHAVEVISEALTSPHQTNSELLSIQTSFNTYVSTLMTASTGNLLAKINELKDAVSSVATNSLFDIGNAVLDANVSGKFSGIDALFNSALGTTAGTDADNLIANANALYILSVSRYKHKISDVLSVHLTSMINNIVFLDNLVRNAVTTAVQQASDQVNIASSAFVNVDETTSPISNEMTDIQATTSPTNLALEKVADAIRLLVRGNPESKNYRFIFPMISPSPINENTVRVNITKQILCTELNYSMIVNTRNSVARSLLSDSLAINTSIMPSNPIIKSIVFDQTSETINILFFGDYDAKQIINFYNGTTPATPIATTTIPPNDLVKNGDGELLAKIDMSSLSNPVLINDLYRVNMRSSYVEGDPSQTSPESNNKYFAYSYEPDFSIDNFLVEIDFTRVYASLELVKALPEGQSWSLNNAGVWNYVCRLFDNNSIQRKADEYGSLLAGVNSDPLNASFFRNTDTEFTNHAWKAEIILNRKLNETLNASGVTTGLNGHDPNNQQVKDFKALYEEPKITLNKIVERAFTPLSKPTIVATLLGKNLFQVEVKDPEQLIRNNVISYSLGLFEWDTRNNDLYYPNPSSYDSELTYKLMHAPSLGNIVTETINIANSDFVLDNIITMPSTPGKGSYLMTDYQTYVLAVRTNINSANLPAYSEWGFSRPFTKADLINDVVVPELIIDDSNVVNNNNVVFNVSLPSINRQSLKMLQIWRCDKKGEYIGSLPIINVTNPIFTLNDVDNKYYNSSQTITINRDEEYFFKALLKGTQGEGFFESDFNVFSPAVRHETYVNTIFNNIVVSPDNLSVSFNLDLRLQTLVTLKTESGTNFNLVGIIIPKPSGGTPSAGTSMAFISVQANSNQRHTITFTSEILNNNVMLFGLTTANRIITHGQGSFFGNLF
jgi:hypothetical protein